MKSRANFDHGLHKGQVVKATIAALAPGGEGVTRDHGPAIFVGRVAPGDVVEIELFDVRKDFAWGRAVAIVEASPQRAEPPCKLFKVCGGCQWQHIAYESQLKDKEDLVRQTIKHIGGLDPDIVLPAMAAPQPLYYRNKVQFPVGHPRGSNRILAGYYKRNSHDLVNIKHCPVQPEPLDRMVEKVKEASQFHGVSAYDEHTRRGILRHIVARYSFDRQEVLLTLVVNVSAGHEHVQPVDAAGVASPESGDDDPLAGGGPSGNKRGPDKRNNRGAISQLSADELVRLIQPVARDVMEAVGEVKGVCVNFNYQAGNRILGDKSLCVAGQDHIIERISADGEDVPERLRQGLEFRLSPHSFFQVNSGQIAPLLEEVRASVSGFADLVVDAYAGVGTIALWLAPTCSQVIAVEEHGGAVADGIANCRLNRLDNVEFRHCRVEEALPALTADGQRPTCLVLDPPRKGVSEPVLGHIAEMRVKRIVYVSCNPATLARDLRILALNGYKTRKIRPIDMFPQTYHVESVAVIDLDD